MKQQPKERLASKRLQAIQTSRHWQFSHSRHTGHKIPHSHTSYPLLVMLVLCTGVFLVGWTALVTANSSPTGPGVDYTVHASVPGPAPTQAATIDTPANGMNFTTTPVTVSGTCPLNTYVQLFRNNFASGIALCSATGDWKMSTDFFQGQDALMVKDYSFTDVSGPDSGIVSVTYTPPPVTGNSSNNNQKSSSSNVALPAQTIPSQSSAKTPAGNSSASPTGLSANGPFVLQSIFKYQGTYTDQSQSWQVSVSGGTSPYALDVLWGDGSRQLISRASAGPFTISHTYHQAGGYDGSYVVQISATDNAGTPTYLQFIALVNDKPIGVGSASGNRLIGSTGSSSSSNSNLGHDLKYIWPSYGVVVLMLSSFWLGERQEFRYLRTRHKRHRHA